MFGHRKDNISEQKLIDIQNTRDELFLKFNNQIKIAPMEEVLVDNLGVLMICCDESIEIPVFSILKASKCPSYFFIVTKSEDYAIKVFIYTHLESYDLLMSFIIKQLVNVCRGASVGGILSNATLHEDLSINYTNMKMKPLVLLDNSNEQQKCVDEINRLRDIVDSRLIAVDASLNYSNISAVFNNIIIGVVKMHNNVLIKTGEKCIYEYPANVPESCVNIGSVSVTRRSTASTLSNRTSSSNSSLSESLVRANGSSIGITADVDTDIAGTAAGEVFTSTISGYLASPYCLWSTKQYGMVSGHLFDKQDPTGTSVLFSNDHETQVLRYENHITLDRSDFAKCRTKGYWLAFYHSSLLPLDADAAEWFSDGGCRAVADVGLVVAQNLLLPQSDAPCLSKYVRRDGVDYPTLPNWREFCGVVSFVGQSALRRNDNSTLTPGGKQLLVVGYIARIRLEGNHEVVELLYLAGESDSLENSQDSSCGDSGAQTHREHLVHSCIKGGCDVYLPAEHGITSLKTVSKDRPDGTKAITMTCNTLSPIHCSVEQCRKFTGKKSLRLLAL